MKIAIVCDFLVKFGGAQQVLLALHKAFPEAPIYCLLYDENKTKGAFKDCQIITSNLQKWPAFLRKRPKFLLPLFPKAVESFDFSAFDAVISSSDSYCKGIITKPKTLHLCYCHTPMRYAWDWSAEYLKENKIGFGPKGLLVRHLIHKIRLWDRVSAFRVDRFIANSINVQKRIAKYYRADAEVIYPPVNTREYQPSFQEAKDFYLIISRLEPYKKIALAVDTFNILGKKLIIIGEGSERAALETRAKENIQFLGWQDNAKIAKYLADCQALIFPGEEDFGITPVEAMAAGRPVIAFSKGGVGESVIDGKTGLFFDQASTESLKEAVLRFESTKSDFDPRRCQEQAANFSEEVFIQKVKDSLAENYKKHLQKYT
jgi:glycosyltransferase involved in cell wall biosynthesis